MEVEREWLEGLKERERWMIVFKAPAGYQKLPPCQCKKCQEIATVPQEENVLRMKETVVEMCLYAGEDLFPPAERSDEKLPTPGEGWLARFEREACGEGAKSGVARILAMSPKQQVTTRADMKSAYAWFMLDNRALFLFARDQDERILRDEVGLAIVEANLPFLVACEFLGISVEAVRSIITRGMKLWGLTPERVLDVKLPLVGPPTRLPAEPPKPPKPLTMKVVSSFRLKPL